MPYSQITPVIGLPQQGYVNSVDLVQKNILGTTVMAVDNYFGFGEFKYVQFPAGAAITQGQVVTWSGFGGSAGYSAAVAANTANTGRPIGIAINSVANLGVVQYGWIQITGQAVIKAAASVAAGSAFGIDATTGGSVNANSAGRQVLNAVVSAASTLTVVKTAQLTNGSPVITVSDTAGWVPGLTASGTGVSGTILLVDPDNRRVTLSANATTGGASSVTMTYTGFIVATIDRSFLQGAIT